MLFPGTTKLCSQCLTNNGLSPPAVMLDGNPGYIVFLPVPEAPEVRAALLEFMATATPCPHSFTTPEQRAAGNTWAELNAKLSAIPAAPSPPTEDPYADIRTRLTVELSEALSRANGLGGLV